MNFFIWWLEILISKYPYVTIPFSFFPCILPHIYVTYLHIYVINVFHKIWFPVVKMVKYIKLFCCIHDNNLQFICYKILWTVRRWHIFPHNLSREGFQFVLYLFWNNLHISIKRLNKTNICYIPFFGNLSQKVRGKKCL